MSDSQEELGIKGSIKAACINIIINTFSHQVFLGLTLSLMKRILPWSLSHFSEMQISRILSEASNRIIILRLSSAKFPKIFSHESSHMDSSFFCISSINIGII